MINGPLPLFRPYLYEPHNVDKLVGGEATTDSILSPEYFSAEMACDNNTSTGWVSASSGFPHWWKYDFGEGQLTNIIKLRIFQGIERLRDFTIQGSNDDSQWELLYSDTLVAVSGYQEFTFININYYRYYKINFLTISGSETFAEVDELEMM